MLFCGVFDGHGPYGHKVARHVRDNLPTKLSKAIELSKLNSCKYGDVHVPDKDLGDDYREPDDRDYGNSSTDDGAINKDDQSDNSSRILSLSSWEACLIKSFKEMDQELSLDSTIDSFCSGSTAVTVVKQVSGTEKFKSPDEKYIRLIDFHYQVLMISATKISR